MGHAGLTVRPSDGGNAYDLRRSLRRPWGRMRFRRLDTQGRRGVALQVSCVGGGRAGTRPPNELSPGHWHDRGSLDGGQRPMSLRRGFRIARPGEVFNSDDNRPEGGRPSVPGTCLAPEVPVGWAGPRLCAHQATGVGHGQARHSQAR